MAKKRTTKPRDETARKPHASQIRTQTLSVKEIKDQLEDLKIWVETISGHLESAVDSKVEEITIDGATKLTAATEQLDAFATNVSRGVSRAIIEKRREERSSQQE